MSEAGNESEPTQAWSGTPDARAFARPAHVEGDALWPGSLIAARFRIVARIGAGGMGSVYRAHDMQLGQEVAIKFLAGKWADDPRSAAALRREVRNARRVTHRNVCRVHDVGEFEGVPFLTMELVEGEDLGALLRRIGRLPHDKAQQIAVQVGSGLQAAHDQGVIHRDLKPQNVMLDNRGDAHITDFGIAATLDELDDQRDFVGTPSYMAPELFVGATPSVATDVFSFGALLHEIFTGRVPFRGEDLKGLLASHREPVLPIGRLAPEVDPAIERIVQRCLAYAPDERPASVLEVLAALPGWDPIAEARSRGETPAPHVVASARGTGHLSARTASLLAVVLVAAVALVGALMQRFGLVAKTRLPHPGAVLAEDARRHLAALGYPFDRARAFEAWAFDFYEELIREIARDVGPDRWEQLEGRRPTAIDFYYRRSPRPLVPSATALHLAWDDPPIRVPGMVQVRLDPSGGLRELVAVSDEAGDVIERGVASPAAAPATDWNAVLSCAALDPTLLEPAAPIRVPQVFADQRAAWIGTYPESGLPIRVEAASLRGRVVSFRIVERDLAGASQPAEESVPETPWERRGPSIFDLFEVFVFSGTACLAWLAIRRRRANYRGAVRLAVFVVGLVTVATLCMARHAPNLSAELSLAGSAVSRGLIRGALFWLLYVGLEPQVRRIWPETLVSWTRLFDGRTGDRLVWSNVLAGMTIGVGVLLLRLGYGLLCFTLDVTSPAPPHEDLITAAALDGPASALGALLHLALRYLGFGVSTVMAMVLLKLVLKRQSLGLLASVCLLTAVFAAGNDHLRWFAWPISAVQAAFCTWGVLRHGLLGLVVGSMTFGILWGFPLTFDLGAWYVGSGLLALAVVIGTIAVAGRALARV